MRFRFCGDGDCPDWLLAQINILSKMDCEKLQLLVENVVQAILSENLEKSVIEELTKNSSLDVTDCKTAVAAIHFILTSSTKYATTKTNLSNELQQIGLSNEQTKILCDVYNDNYEDLSKHMKDKSLRCSTLNNFECSNNDNGKNMIININSWQSSTNKEQVTSFIASHQQARMILHDLKMIYERNLAI